MVNTKTLINHKNLTYLPEISQTFFCYSLQFTMLNRGACFLKKGVLIRKDQRDFFERKSKKIASLMKMHPTLKVP